MVEVSKLVRRLTQSRPNCLEKSLLLLRYLGRAGEEPCLVVGIRQDAGSGTTGHVWIEIEGAPFEENESTLRAFTRVVEYDTRGCRSNEAPAQTVQ